MNLLPVGAVHLPKINDLGNARGKDKKPTSQDLVDLSLNKNVIIEKQVIETVAVEKDTDKKSEEVAGPAKNSAIIFTITYF